MKLSILILIPISLFFSNALFGQEKIETNKIKLGYRTIHTEIIIDAKPEQVWEVLTDTDSYKNWAKFMVNLEGEIIDRAPVSAYFLMNEKRGKIEKMDHIISVRAGTEFSWSDVFMLGMKDHHRFIVEPTSDGKTRFIQSDLVHGGLAWLLAGSVIKFEAKNYPIFNRSLKAEVEKRFPRD